MLPPPTTKAETWRALHRTADSFRPRFRTPLLASIEALRRQVTLEQLEESAARGTLTANLSEAIDQVKVAKTVDPAVSAEPVYAELLTLSGNLAAQQLNVALRFDVTSPQVLRAARELTAFLIRDVTQETKAAVRRIIHDSIRDGIAPRESARLIRQIIGLTSRQATAVGRYQKGLLDGGVDFMSAEQKAGRYAQRLLRDRAENIARTETMRAANRGQQILWTDMQNQGLLPAEFEQKWLTTPDDRLCPRCAPMNGRTVQLGYLFRETERGVLPSTRKPVAGATVLSPPLHPRCRCTLVMADD